MLVSDEVIFGVVGAFALTFSIASFFIPTHGTYLVESQVSEDRDEVESVLRIGRLFAQIRIPAFFMLAGAFWIALGFMFGSINNCGSSFNACYTSPLYSATTGTIIPFTYGIPLEALFILIGAFFIVMFSVAIVGWFLAVLSKRREPPKPYSGPT